MSHTLNWWDQLWLKIEFRRRNLTLGQKGERVAKRFLQRRGLKIVAHSMRNIYGEIDLIAVDKRTVVFVEVKTRSSNFAGEPAEAVDANKQRHMTTAALTYLRRHRLLEHAARFDVVTLVWADDQRFPQVEHLENAFSPVGDFQMFG